MNKKFIRLISVLLSVMVLFSCTIIASADDSTTPTPAPAEKIKVSIRVEGLSKNLAETSVVADKLCTVKAAIDAAALDVLYAEDGVTIKSVKGEAEITTSKWQYAVNGTIKTEAVNACVLDKDTEIILFNATENAVIPSFDAKDIATGGVIVFNGTNKSGVTAPIADATVKWENATYVTDSKGRVLISDQSQLKEGKHSIEISKVNEYGVPMVVRLDDDAVVDVPKVEGSTGEAKTLFEEIYDFLYSILKGILEVWAFYFNALTGIFQGNLPFQPVPATPVA